MKARTALALTAALALAAPPLAAQTRPKQPWASPRAQVAQTIGISEVRLDYSRPAAKGRVVFGELEAFGEVWRAGANENTTITFSHDATVEGQAIAAGTYGLHMIPGASSFTVIFSRNTHAWGSYSYDSAEDALRVQVTPTTGPHQEWMEFQFTDLSSDGATLELRWSSSVVPMKIGIDTKAVTLAYLRDDYLRGLDRFFWQGWNNAASWCLQNDVELGLAREWAARSVSITANFSNLWLSSLIADKLGDAGAVGELRARAMALATEPELNTAGYQLLQSKRLDDAIALFRANVENHPGSWNCWDSLAEALATKGDVPAAIEHYRKALELAEDETQQARIAGELRKLGAG